ncbi:MAG: LD-carboxypeptidase [Alteromonadaceae bacterium]|nr:LD-carboxypeptidase [Alteromonadaceae bacterium]
MRYPAPLTRGSKIAVTAFSSGVESGLWQRLDHILEQWRSKGFEIVEGQCLRENHHYVSADKHTRASELQAFLCDDSVAAVVAPFGGEFATDLLPLLDYEVLNKQKPKWLLGYSDISTITCAITTKLNWVTVHSACLMELLDEQSDDLTRNTLTHLNLREGNSFVQESSSHYQQQNPNWIEEPLATFVLDQPTKWYWLNTTAATTTSISGRLFGGCLDTLVNLFATPYVDFQAFKQQHANDGVVLYLENVEMSPQGLKRALLSMDFKKVFDGINGVVLGRSCGPNDAQNQLTYETVISEFFTDKSFPVIVDADIGHKPPNLVLFNGAVVTISLENNKGQVVQQLI